MSVLEKIKVFVSDTELMLEFIDSVNTIVRIESCNKGCVFKFFFVSS